MIKVIFLVVSAFVLVGTSSCKESHPSELINKEVIIDIDSLITLYPDSVDLLLKRGSENFDKYDYDLAINDFAKAFRLDSNNLQARLLYAEVLNNRAERSVQDVAAAQRNYKIVVNKNPKNTRALVGLASTFLYQQDFKTTFQYVNEALRIDPKYRNAYVLKGTTYLALDNRDLAKSSYETAIQQDPEFYEAYFLLGQLYQEEDNPLCVEYFVSAQKLKPENLEFKYQVAYSKQNYNQVEGAKEMFREMARDTVDIYVMRALFHLGYIKQFENRDLDSAMYFYKSALETDPRFYEAWYNLGICHEEKGNINQALKSYGNCLKYNPEFEAAIKRANNLR
ncbi:MAG TPA: tetratricopeptide repeat protein [Crocinitomicaceae bacterium]|nr:tetratricopeptide repeat protein [Crocinitomicaceae bacterium]